MARAGTERPPRTRRRSRVEGLRITSERRRGGLRGRRSAARSARSIGLVVLHQDGADVLVAWRVRPASPPGEEREEGDERHLRHPVHEWYRCGFAAVALRHRRESDGECEPGVLVAALDGHSDGLWIPQLDAARDHDGQHEPAHDGGGDGKEPRGVILPQRVGRRRVRQRAHSDQPDARQLPHHTEDRALRREIPARTHADEHGGGDDHHRQAELRVVDGDGAAVEESDVEVQVCGQRDERNQRGGGGHRDREGEVGVAEEAPEPREPSSGRGGDHEQRDGGGGVLREEREREAPQRGEEDELAAEAGEDAGAALEGLPQERGVARGRHPADQEEEEHLRRRAAHGGTVG
mmetsp:Transcript_19558/g.44922  ORF Transcript_19558/g.44922 Transcript_19558/m.44922 type:complete len:350 (-) Transcript_19558:5-1054(-)